MRKRSPDVLYGAIGVFAWTVSLVSQPSPALTEAIGSHCQDALRRVVGLQDTAVSPDHDNKPKLASIRSGIAYDDHALITFGLGEIVILRGSNTPRENHCLHKMS